MIQITLKRHNGIWNLESGIANALDRAEVGTAWDKNRNNLLGSKQPEFDPIVGKRPNLMSTDPFQGFSLTKANNKKDSNMPTRSKDYQDEDRNDSEGENDSPDDSDDSGKSNVNNKDEEEEEKKSPPARKPAGGGKAVKKGSPRKGSPKKSPP
jgi:hypothetical protein